MTPRVREIRFHPLRTRRECPPRWDARTGAPATPRPRNRAARPAHDGSRGDTARDSALTAYLARCNELGAMEGPLGARTLSPALRPVLEALHHVLAGGEVSVQLVQRGNADIVNELNLRAERATEESSSLGTAGDILSATV
ncbi:hypothetical protein [Myxococcus sp. NMCA1]|uniref:hypothetical protein n=1 Tax=Myxococcus sp. NMCA1 TaxID=2996785 RepID=UPI0022866CEE|nr:hypothetical protein [Myxococcus sp. NMCA1]WAM26658.1 hypothetical protein OZ403_00645 [Myxococcus sp. NMCA1]